MSEIDQDKKSKKDALKNLREARKEWVGKASAKLKAQRKDLAAIRGALKQKAGTVPMIAQATGIPPDKVLWYVATLKKYGEIVEGEKEDGYFQYVLVDRAELSNEENTL